MFPLHCWLLDNLLCVRRGFYVSSSVSALSTYLVVKKINRFTCFISSPTSVWMIEVFIVMEFALPFRPTLRFITFWWFVFCMWPSALFSLVISNILPTGLTSLTTVLSTPIVGDKVEGLDIFTVLWSILYKAMVSSSVLHHNAFFFVADVSVSNESKLSHSLFCIVLLIVLPNEKHCIQLSCKQSSFQQNYIDCGHNSSRYWEY